MNRASSIAPTESWKENRSIDAVDHIEAMKRSSGYAGARASSSASTTYTKLDILSGRGGLANKHTGNRVFRRLIKQNKEQYKNLKSKRKQNLLIESILLAVESQGSRFLKEDKQTNTWHEIGYKDAWAKTCQALREPDKKSDSSSTCSDPPTGTGPPPPSRPASKKRKASTAAIATSSSAPRPTALARQYTNENPPCADRHVFDEEVPCVVDESAVAAAPTAAATRPPPALLEMASTWSALGRAPVPPRYPPYHQQGYAAQHQQHHQYRTAYQHRQAVPVEYDMPPASIRVHHYQQHEQQQQQQYGYRESEYDAAVPPQQQQQQRPPQPTFLRMTSSAFYRDLENVLHIPEGVVDDELVVADINNDNNDAFAV